MIKTKQTPITTKHWIVIIIAVAILLLGAFLVVSAKMRYSWLTVGSSTLAVNRVNASKELVEHIKNQEPGCEGMNADSKDFQVILQEQAGFAKTMYGCNPDAYTFYKQTNGKWTNINTTNQFMGDIPSCEIVNSYQIPVIIAPFCHENFGTSAIISVKNRSTPNVE